MTAQNEFKNAAAAARWFNVPDWFDGTDFCGPRLVAYIDVKEEGLRRMVALHEIAHLLVDSETVSHGHGQQWVVTYRNLIEKYISSLVHAMWELAFEEESRKSAEKIADDPMWLALMIEH
jgi:hypothetical protein